MNILDQETYANLTSGAAATKALQKDATTQGISTSTGVTFYDLRGPAYLEYPVNTPLRNSIPRLGKVNAGVGTAAHWKAFINPNAANTYIGVSEGQRNAFFSYQEKDFLATYKELGVEGKATFTAQFAGEGYTNPLADLQEMDLHNIFIGEEKMILGGNTSLQLGTAPTPTLASQTTGGVLASGTNVSVAVVALTHEGVVVMLPTVTAGLVPTQTRQNADGTANQVNGGTSAISALSAIVTTSGTTGSVVATVVAKRGAVAYAWYVNVTDASAPQLAHAYLAAITSAPTYTVTTSPTGTQVGSATGLNTDYSTNPLSFDGLLTLAFNTTGAYWKDLGGAVLTPNGDGTVVEIEAVLLYLWQQFNATVDTIRVSADQLYSLAAVIRASTSGNPAAYRININQDELGRIIGGSLVTGYMSKYTMGGAKTINIELHPYLPSGTIYFDISTNPYPQSRLAGIREIWTQREYYSLAWPIKTRAWEYGTYVHEVLAHKLPQLTAVLTGVGQHS